MKAIRIIFICHGNICRSTMAEYIFRDMAEKAGCGARFSVESRATSTEELGNPVHPGTRRVLNRLGIDCRGKYAEQITKSDCDRADLLIIMDERNRRGLTPFIGNNQGKVKKLLEYAGEDRDVADPWYTGDFETTYRDVDKGCRAMLKALAE
ncbi:MAG: low molecular weight phosphotyrosine protein phosphatase [Clostridia bacterium]|nr:low molecular weight phosphotyrosine protein phosphatase [Clostridia bacterium]